MAGASGYFVITDAWPDGDELVVRFANDDVVRFKKTRFVSADRPDILWHELCIIDDGLGIAVPNGFGSFEIPGEDIRVLKKSEA